MRRIWVVQLPVGEDLEQEKTSCVPAILMTIRSILCDTLIAEARAYRYHVEAPLVYPTAKSEHGLLCHPCICM